MPRAAQGRFQPSGKRMQLFRQYNVSVDTGAFEICHSRPRAPTCRRCRASKYDQLGSTCTHSPYHACPCAHFLGGGVLEPALPSPSPPLHAPSHMHVLRRYVKAGACAHYSACVRMRMRTESACTARLTRSDGSVGCNCTCREHAACNTTILAGWRMRE